MKSNKIMMYALTLVLFLAGIQQVHAQQWLKANGNMYVLPTVKIGIGTATPQRNLEVLNTLDNYLRVSSVGGNLLNQYAAGIELKRSLFNGTTTTWSLVNQSTFKIQKNGIDLFRLDPTIAWLGASSNDPIELAIYGHSINKSGNSTSQGGLRLYSKVGSTLHIVKLDGNQLESSTDFYLNNITDADLILANGGGKVKVGTTDDEARLSVASASDMQLKLINPGNQGGSWRIGVANSTWAAGTGKLVFSKTANSSDATMVITPAGNVGIGLTTPSRTLHVNGTTRTKVLEITGGADLAEPFEMSDESIIQPGMVVAIDPVHAGQLKMATRAYDKTVAGIVSGAGNINPGMVMGQDGTIANGEHPVALTGRVYCKVDAAYGAIQPGDLLTTSDTPGYAMKVTDHTQAQGAIIGKAMTSLEAGQGLVLVLVSLQ